jgi:allantoate deiminase
MGAADAAAPATAASAARVLERLETLFAIGAGEGANRPGLSAEEEQACALAAAWMREAGLEVSWDAVGNIVGRLPGAAPDLPEVWAGSHVDTVPAGGRFDGALGVVAAIEAVGRLAARAGAGTLRRTVGVVVFRDEEGWRFGTGVLGSRALVGQIAAGDLDVRDADGISVGEALAALGREDLVRDGRVVAGGKPPGVFVEAHIEQGPVLADAGAPLGVVTSIVGTAGFRVAFAGAAGHAGTTPMAGRADAVCAAARFALAVREAATAAGDGAVATVGRIETPGGASNVLPARVEVTTDARAGDPAVFAALCAAVERAAADAAAAEGCTATVRPAGRIEPVPMAAVARAALARAVEAGGAPVVEIASGAGHDAQCLAAAGVPAGMLFVRSLAGGVSHRPDEHTDAEAVGLAVDALEHALADLADRPDDAA